MEMIYKCPKCGETENLHYNYDYTKQHRPVIDVLCNECGTFFDGDKSLKSVVDARYIDSLRKKMVESLNDLTDKIKNDEDFPHGKQDVHSLVKISDLIDECLSNWYY